jgi:hypothetical protein
VTIHRAEGAVKDVDPLTSLGEPFASFGRALLAADDARQRLHEAQVAGDLDEIRRAELDREAAIAEVEKIRHHGATTFLMFARWAVELFPGALSVHLDPTLRAELDATQSAIVELERAVYADEGAVTYAS